MVGPRGSRSRRSNHRAAILDCPATGEQFSKVGLPGNRSRQHGHLGTALKCMLELCQKDYAKQLLDLMSQSWTVPCILEWKDFINSKSLAGQPILASSIWGEGSLVTH